MCLQFWFYPIETVMGQDKYTKFILTVIAFSLFFIALNLSAMEFVLYDLYNGEMELFFSEISSRVDEFSSHIGEFSSRLDEISSSIDDTVDAIKKR